MSDLYIFMNTVRDLIRPRKLGAVALLVALPALLAMLIQTRSHHHGSGPQLYAALSTFLVYNFVLVILSVIFGTGVITQEVEQKTIVYLLTRPVARWRILLMKYGATVTVTTITVWLASLALALTTVGARGLPHVGLLRDMGTLLVGALAYNALFLLGATVLERPLMFGLLFAFGWETWVPNLPGKFKYLSLMSYLRVLAPHNTGLDSGPAPNALEAAINADVISNRVAIIALAAAILGALAAALILFSTREYVPREEAA